MEIKNNIENIFTIILNKKLSKSILDTYSLIPFTKYFTIVRIFKIFFHFYLIYAQFVGNKKNC